MKSPILITGCARSGTSMVAGIVHGHGVFGGKMSPPNANNKKGMFENEKIRDFVTKPFLRDIGIDPLCQDVLPEVGKYYPYPDLRFRVESIMKAEGLINGSLWFYKGAKMCLFWKTWKHAFPEARWIIVRRPDEMIVSSCIRTSFMHKRTTKEEWQEWVDVHKRNFDDMRTHCDCTEVWSDKLVTGDTSEIANALERAGIKFRPEVVADFVEPKLYHK